MKVRVLFAIRYVSFGRSSYVERCLCVMMREGWLFTRDSEDGSALMLEVISPVTYLRRKSEMKT